MDLLPLRQRCMTATLTQLATSSRSGMSVSQEESPSKSHSNLVGEDVNECCLAKTSLHSIATSPAHLMDAGAFSWPFKRGFARAVAASRI